jgi:CRP-like cAMP-binding protein
MEPGAICRELREFPLFEELDDEEFAVVQPLFQQVEFSRGQKIIENGAPADDLYLLARGAVSVTLQQAEDKAPERLAAFYAGVVFGEMAMIEDKPRSADVWADRDSACYRLRIPQLRELHGQHPHIYTKIMLQITRHLSDRLRIVSQEVALLKGVSGG